MFPVGVALLLGVVLALIVWLITQQQGWRDGARGGCTIQSAK